MPSPERSSAERNSAASSTRSAATSRRDGRPALDHQPRDAALGQQPQHRGEIEPAVLRRHAQHLDALRAQDLLGVRREPLRRQRPRSGVRVRCCDEREPSAAAADALSSTTRTGERSSMPGSRQVSCGSSASTVPMPTRIASFMRAHAGARASRAASPVIATGLRPASPALPSAETASLSVTCGRALRTRAIWPAWARRASSAPEPDLDRDARRRAAAHGPARRPPGWGLPAPRRRARCRPRRSRRRRAASCRDASRARA